jgi:hypothetical protein
MLPSSGVCPIEEQRPGLGENTMRSAIGRAKSIDLIA